MILPPFWPSHCAVCSLRNFWIKVACQSTDWSLNIIYQGVWFEVCFGGMFRGYVSGYVSPSLVEIMGMIRGMIRGYDSGAWFGVWFAEMQHACDHKFCIRHFWKHSYSYRPKLGYSTDPNSVIGEVDGFESQLVNFSPASLPCNRVKVKSRRGSISYLIASMYGIFTYI